MRRDEGMFARQAAWQRSRAKLPWEEKLRLCVVMRAACRALRRGDGSSRPRVRRETPLS
jgi:hypothetical protein